MNLGKRFIMKCDYINDYCEYEEDENGFLKYTCENCPYKPKEGE